MRRRVSESAKRDRKCWVYAVSMRAVYVVVMGCVSGCMSQPACDRQEVSYEWADMAVAKAKVVSGYISQWAAIESAMETTGFSCGMTEIQLLRWMERSGGAAPVWIECRSRVGEQIRQGLFRLWVITGHNAFGGVRREMVVAKSSAILDDYLRFIRDHSGEKRAQVVKGCLRETVQAIDTPFHNEALAVIGEVCYLTRPLPTDEVFVGDETACDKRRRDYRAMLHWLDVNEVRLTWNAWLQKLDCDGQECSLPNTVYDSSD